MNQTSNMKILILLVLLGSILQKINAQDMKDLTCVANISDEEWEKEIKVSFSEAEMSILPDSFDWRAKNAITPVRYQGECGSCWALTVAAAIESAEFIFNNGSTQLEVLSPQTLIDCDTSNNGCEGGDIRKAFLFATRSPGLLSEDDYPYRAEKRPCMLPVDDGVKSVTIVGYGVLDAFHDSIRKAVTRQPLVVTIEYAPDSEFRKYKSGIFRGPCGEGKLHSLLLVGFGTTDQGEKYWIMKNSWSRIWGEEGYIRMLNDETQSGLCGMNTRVAFPIPLGAF